MSGLVIARHHEVSDTVAVKEMRHDGHRPVYEIECDGCGWQDHLTSWDAAVIAGEDHECTPAITATGSAVTHPSPTTKE